MPPSSPPAANGFCSLSSCITGGRWPSDANAKPVMTIATQKELEKLRAQDQRVNKALKGSCSARRRPWLRRWLCWCCEKRRVHIPAEKPAATVRSTRKADQCLAPAEGDRADWRGQCCGRWPSEGLRCRSDSNSNPISIAGTSSMG